MSRKLTIEEKCIRALMKRKSEYELYFKSKIAKTPKTGNENEPVVIQAMDNQAQNAYTSIVKTIVELSRKTQKDTVDPEEMKRVAEEILEKDYGIKR